LNNSESRYAGLRKILRQYELSSQIKLIECDKLRFEAKLSEIQTSVVNKILSHFFSEENYKSGQAGCIIDMPPGLGKSHTAAFFSSLYGNTAIIIHSSVTLQQWKQVYRQCYPSLKDEDIGEYHATKKKMGKIMFLVVKSASKDKFTIDGKEISALDFYRNFNLIIFDECHKYANPENRRVFKCAQAPYMLGLSGTPLSRLDGFDPIVHWNIGQIFGYSEFILNDAKGLVEDVKFEATVHKINYEGPALYTRFLTNSGTGTFSSSSTITMVCEDMHRQEVILNCIDDALSKKLYVLVFADRCEYLSLLVEKYKKRLERRNNIEECALVSNENEYMRVVGGAKEDEMTAATNLARVIFTTYQFMDTGKSIPRMTAIILATPRKSNIDQTIGRILRINSDTSIRRHIYDVVDVGVKLCNQWKTRNFYYKRAKFDVEVEKYNWESIPIT
jgi:superfamily II DNA or RNA helicase